MLRRQPEFIPGILIVLAGEHNPVVKPAAAALPKFDAPGNDPESAPMLRAGNDSLRKLFAVHTLTGFEQGTVPDYLALRRGPCADTAFGRTGVKIKIAFRAGYFLRDPFDTDLTFKLFPEKYQRGMRVGRQVPAFGTLVVREEYKTFFIQAFEQYNTGMRLMQIINGSEGHRIDLADLRGDRFLEPFSEKGKGIVAGGGFIKRSLPVIRADTCNMGGKGQKNLFS